jgi:hypothetical protein
VCGARRGAGKGVEAIFRPEGVTATACEGGGDSKVLRDGEIAEQTPVLRSPGNSGYGAPIGRRRSQIIPLKPQICGATISARVDDLKSNIQVSVLICVTRGMVLVVGLIS